ncbi:MULTISPECIES: glycosyltransferase [unclassified Cyanobium]|uniref:glycosyltransferase n=1 Tax=unclassified Cyanobium TaxID=2627006 RepID=UPI0020CEF7B0|nr:MULTISPECIES: glycosyltransferase [unclassified Cyanobium]
MPQKSRITFVSTAYNEAGNLEELLNRCHNAFQQIQDGSTDALGLQFSFVIADNASTDESLVVLSQLQASMGSIDVLLNQRNYGPEASAANALRQARDSDLIVLLCSDLQDPPELAASMVQMLLGDQGLDAVLAVKKKSSGNSLLRLARRSYYNMLGYSTRFQLVPTGFHGFGCYRRETINEALRCWELTDLNLRQCLANASQSAIQMDYLQLDRIHGKSSYGKLGYWKEAWRSIAVGDATASRLALTIGGASLFLAVVIGLILLVNVLRGSSRYVGGIPTVMGLSILSLSLQMLMFSLLSRQIEALRMRGIRPRVLFRRVKSPSGSTLNTTSSHV